MNSITTEFSVWIVTANRELRRRWELELTRAGFVCVALDTVSALTGASEAGSSPTISLIDGDLLLQEGERAVSGLRRASLRFIVFGRRDRHDDAALVRWLDAGADDFIDAASDPALVAAKLRAHLRRLPAPGPQEGTIISPKKQIKLDPSGRSAWRKGTSGWEELRLTLKEFALLSLFLQNAGAVLNRRAILEQVWGASAGDVNPETVDKHIESLRKKLGEAGAAIQTIYGAGYAFKE